MPTYSVDVNPAGNLRAATRKPRSATTPILDIECAVFAEEVREDERRLISAGWDAPPELHAAALEHGLTGTSFHDTAMSFMFRILCECAMIHHVPSEPEVVQLARRGGFPLPTGIYGYLHDLRMLEHGLGGIGCMNYAKFVVRNAKRYHEAREHLRKARELLGDEGLYTRLLNEAPVSRVPRRVPRHMQTPRRRKPTSA